MRVIRDLYRDLSDRGLRLVPVGLLALIVAVPVFLTDAPKPELTVEEPPAAEVAAREALASMPVVVEREVGLRDYRERLRGFQAKNPFRQQLRETRDIEDEMEAAGVDEPSTGATLPVDLPGNVEPPSTPAGRSGGGSGGSGGSGGGSGERTPAPEPERIEKWWEFVADVRFSEGDGDPETLRGVKPLDLIPDERRPFIAYLGSDMQLKKATFLVDLSTTATSGDGNCMPAEGQCRFLTLEPGQTQVLTVEADGGEVTYRLELLRLRRVEVEPPEEERKARPSSSKPGPIAEALGGFARLFSATGDDEG